MTPALRRRSALAALVIGVAGAHWLVLQHAPEPVQPGPAGAHLHSLQVRAVLPAPATAPAPAPPRVDAVAPPRRSIVPASRAPVHPAPDAPRPVVESPAAATPAVAVPGSATLHYRASARIRGVELTGQAQLDWRHDGSRYQAGLEVALPDRPARIQRSTGSITARGLAPQRFSDHTRSEEAAHFDRTAQRIIFSTNRPAAALEAGAQDRVSVLLQMAALVAGQPDRYRVGSSVLLPTAGTREAETWRFTLEAQETLALPAASVPAMHWVRRPTREYEPLLELWLGPGPTYAPVRLRLTHPGGDWLDLQWSGTDKG